MRTAFSDVRPQPAGLLTIPISEAVVDWIYKRLPETDERDGLLARLMAMHDAAAEIGQLHETSSGAPEAGAAVVTRGVLLLRGKKRR